MESHLDTLFIHSAKNSSANSTRFEQYLQPFAPDISPASLAWIISKNKEGVLAAFLKLSNNTQGVDLKGACDFKKLDNIQTALTGLIF